MTSEVVHLPRGEAQHPAGTGLTYNQNQLDLLKRTVANGTSDDEFALFCHVAQRAGLDPFARQIYAIMRGGKMTIQTGIDGYRLIASRTGQHAGTDDATFTYNNPDDPHPATATTTVWKIVNGQRCAFTSTARWAEYSADQGLWKKMPHTMLAKCSEALALRKAFPAELSGLYTDDEMAPADRVVETKATPRKRGANYTDPGWWDGYLKHKGVAIDHLESIGITSTTQLAALNDDDRSEVLAFVANQPGEEA